MTSVAPSVFFWASRFFSPFSIFWRSWTQLCLLWENNVPAYMRDDTMILYLTIKVILNGWGWPKMAKQRSTFQSGPNGSIMANLLGPFGTYGPFQVEIYFAPKTHTASWLK